MESQIILMFIFPL